MDVRIPGNIVMDNLPVLELNNEEDIKSIESKDLNIKEVKSIDDEKEGELKKMKQ